MDREIKVNTVYKHFKGDLYLVVDFAYHTENEERLVICRALYGDYKLWARPYGSFVSEVDHDKYPKVKQKYRFEEVKIESLNK